MTTSAYDMLRSVAPASVSGSPSTLPLSSLHRDPTQPRQKFDEASLADLAASIKHSGIIEPLVVTTHPEREGEWIILVGERRYRAAEKAGLDTVPVVIRTQISAAERLVLQLSENDQRQDLRLKEKAEGYMSLRKLMPDKTVGELAAMLGKKQAAFSNVLLAAKVTDGPAFEALEEDLIKDADALRLFVALPQEDQKKLLTSARSAAVTLSRPVLQRFKEGKAKPPSAAPRPTPADAGGPVPSDTDQGPDSPAAPAALASARAAVSGSTVSDPPSSAPAPKIANDYLSALTWRHWQILFTHLGIPLPDDPDDAGYSLLEFLEAHGAQS
jgi:ParB family chromosome partitioning protein